MMTCPNCNDTGISGETTHYHCQCEAGKKLAALDWVQAVAELGLDTPESEKPAVDAGGDQKRT